MLARFGLRNGPLIHDALWNVKVATWNMSEASLTLKSNSDAEWTETKKATAKANDLLGHLDCSLNGCPGLFHRKAVKGLLPEATRLVQKAQPVMDNLATATSRLNDAIATLNTLLQKGSLSVDELRGNEKLIEKLIADLDAQVTDPHIKELLANLADAVKSGADATAQFAAIATDGRQVADKARETYLKPVNLWWGLVKELLPLAGAAAQVVK
jgi:hypothetical protein